MSLKLLEFTDHVVLHDADADNAVEADIRTGPTTLKSVHISLDPASSQAAFLKLFDNQNPVAGTTEPDDIIPITLKTEVSIPFGKNGVLFSKGLSYFLSQSAGKATGSAVTGTNKITFILT